MIERDVAMDLQVRLTEMTQKMDLAISHSTRLFHEMDPGALKQGADALVAIKEDRQEQLATLKALNESLAGLKTNMSLGMFGNTKDLEAQLRRSMLDSVTPMLLDLSLRIDGLIDNVTRTENTKAYKHLVEEVIEVTSEAKRAMKELESMHETVRSNMTQYERILEEGERGTNIKPLMLVQFINMVLLFIFYAALR